MLRGLCGAGMALLSNRALLNLGMYIVRSHPFRDVIPFRKMAKAITTNYEQINTQNSNTISDAAEIEFSYLYPRYHTATKTLHTAKCFYIV